MKRIIVQLIVDSMEGDLEEGFINKLSVATAEIAREVIDENGLQESVQAVVIVMAVERPHIIGDVAGEIDEFEEPPVFASGIRRTDPRVKDWWGATLGCNCEACRRKRFEDKQTYNQGIALFLN